MKKSYYRKRPLRHLVCTHCFAEFQAKRSDALYCSASCNTLAYLERHREEHTNSLVKAQKEGMQPNITKLQHAALAAGGAIAAKLAEDGVKALTGYESPEVAKIRADLAEIKDLLLKSLANDHTLNNNDRMLAQQIDASVAAAIRALGEQQVKLIDMVRRLGGGNHVVMM